MTNCISSSFSRVTRQIRKPHRKPKKPKALLDGHQEELSQTQVFLVSIEQRLWLVTALARVESKTDFLQFQKLLTVMIHCCQEFLQPVRRPPRQTAVESKTDECSNASCSSIATFTTMSQSECLLFAQLVFGDDVPFLNYSDSV